MQPHEFRDLGLARRFVAQGLWLQRAAPVDPASVRPTLEWAKELLSAGHPLPPLGFVADLGHAVFGPGEEDRPDRAKQSPPHVSTALLTAYEDHVLGKLYADGTFSAASESLRRYREGRDRDRGMAFVLSRFGERAGLGGIIFAPGMVASLLSEPPEQILAQGFESLQGEGILPELESLLQELVTRTRGMSDVLGKEDLLELQTGSALDEEGDRLAIRQVGAAAAILEASLPRQRPRLPPLRQEVPTRVLDEDRYPVGGFSSLSNRGSIESLLHSQLAYIEEDVRPDLFDLKFLRDELLYYSRDENEFLRRRRSFVFVLYPDLAERIHFKDPDSNFQRGVLLLALLYVVVHRLSEWLTSDALIFTFLFIVPPSPSSSVPLEQEYELLARLFREEVHRDEVTFDFLLVGQQSQSEASRQQAERLRERLGRIQTKVTEQSSEESVQQYCERHARRSLCHCLSFSSLPRPLQSPSFPYSQVRLDGPYPRLLAHKGVAEVPEFKQPMEHWCLLLQQILTGLL